MIIYKTIFTPVSNINYALSFGIFICPLLIKNKYKYAFESVVMAIRELYA